MMNSRPKSLILITVDCLRADHVGFMGYHRPTTPFLDSLAADSFVVPTAIVSGAPTFYSFPGLMASRHPLALGRDIIGIAPDETTLAGTLRESGYATAAFIAANPYLSSRFGYDQGFDLFRDFGGQEPRMEAATIACAHARSRLNQSLEQFSRKFKPLSAAYDELYFEYLQHVANPRPDSLDALRRFPASNVIVDQAKAWITTVGDRPFFLWLHLMDPHSPYYPTDEALALMGDDDLTPSRASYLNAFWNRGELGASRLRRYHGDVLALYDAGIRWVDKQVAGLVETLRESRLWDECTLAFTADHGEEFLDHGGRYHPPANLKEEIIHVPLLLRVPGAAKSEVAAAPFSHLNLSPTVLEAMGLRPPAEFKGRSLWTELQSGWGWNDTAIVESVGTCTNPYDSADRMRGRTLVIREKRYKLVLDFDRNREELFDLATDPGEHKPLTANYEKEIRRRLLQQARHHLENSLHFEHSPLRLSGRLAELRLELPQLTH
jgi:arylsulfatase A-like enzyme